MSSIQRTILLSCWLGIAALALVSGSKGFAIFWFAIGFWPSILLASWLSEKWGIQSRKRNARSSQENNDRGELQ